MRKLLPAILIILLIVSPITVGATQGFLYLESGNDTIDFVIDGDLSNIYQTPRLCTLMVGMHSVRLFKMYQGSQTIEVDIPPLAVVRKTVSFDPIDKIDARPAQSIRMTRRYGQLSVLSSPSGAEVYVDGAAMPVRTPVTLDRVEAGKRLIKVVARSFTFEDTIIVWSDSTIVLNLTLDNIEKLRQIERAQARTEFKITVSFPGCLYRRDDDAAPGENTVMIKGIDPFVTIEADSTLSINHHLLAQTQIVQDRTGKTTSKEMPDTTVSFSLHRRLTGLVDIRARSFANLSSRFVNRVEIDGRIKELSIPAGLNDGRPVEILIRFSDTGVITLRYW